MESKKSKERQCTLELTRFESAPTFRDRPTKLHFIQVPERSSVHQLFSKNPPSHPTNRSSLKLKSHCDSHEGISDWKVVEDAPASFKVNYY